MKKINLTLKWVMLFLTVLFNHEFVFAQATTATPFNIWVGGEYLGWSNPGFDLNFTMTGTQYMQLNNTASPGHVGIGLGFSPGNDVFDILPDATFPRTGYGINNQTVLHNYGSNNICVGVGAGQSLTSASLNVLIGSQAGALLTNTGANVFVGFKAGAAAVSSVSANVFVGYEAGAALTSGGDNTFLGLQAGGAATGGSHNTFLGDIAGFKNTTGDENTIVGAHAGVDNNTGNYVTSLGFEAGMVNLADGNTFAGHYSGTNSTNGINNSFFGRNSGINNITGNDNTYLGYNSGCDASQSGLHNSATVGANTIVMNDDNMILGDNNVNVGIGLSGDANGALYKLNVVGTGMFSDISGIIPTANPCTNFSLGVKSFNTGCATDNMGYGGLAIFSDEGANADRLHIYADNSGTTHFMSNANNTSFYDRYYLDSHLGFYTPHGTTVIKDDFPVNPMIPANDSKLYVESQFDGTHQYYGKHINAIHGNNNLDETQPLCNLSGWETVGVRGDCYRIRQRDNVSNTGGYFWAEGATAVNRGVKAIATGINGATNNTGVEAWVSADPYGTIPSTATGTVRFNTGVLAHVLYNNANGINWGGFFEAEGGFSNHGVDGFVNNAAQYNYGGVFQAYNGIKDNVGVKGVAQGGGGNNFAIWGVSTGNNCTIPGIPCAPVPCINAGVCTQVAGYFNGQVYASGGYWTLSDASLKNNLTVLPVPDANVINSINAYSYEFDIASYPTMGMQAGTHYGFSAAEVGANFPNMVTQFQQPAEYDSSGTITKDAVDYLAVNYTEFIPMLWAGYKGLQQQVDSMKQVMTACCNVSPRTTGSNEFPITQTIDLASSAPILYQNQPNPFNGSTVIRYFIPENAVSPKIIFEDETGRVINETAIIEKGQNSIQVNSQLLNSGVYTYSLQIAGKIVDSKKMLKTK